MIYKFYSPVAAVIDYTGNDRLEYAAYFDYDPADICEEGEAENFDYLLGEDILQFAEDINRAIQQDWNEIKVKSGFMEFFLWDSRQAQTEVFEKVESAFPKIEIVNDTAYAVTECSIRANLTTGEAEILKDYFSGQYSDGWGESFEQHAIKTKWGALYVCFWPEGFMMETEEEFQTRIGMEGQNAMREPVEEEKNIFAPMEEEKNMSALAEEEKNISAYVEKIREELHETVDREIDNFLLRLENGELLESKSGLEREIPLSAMPAYFKGKKPVAVLYPDGAEAAAPTWKKAAVHLLQHCAEEPEMLERLKEMQGKVFGRNRLLFGSDGNGMDSPLEFYPGMFLESKFDTETLLKVITKRIFDAVGYDYGGIRLRVADPAPGFRMEKTPEEFEGSAESEIGENGIRKEENEEGFSLTM